MNKLVSLISLFTMVTILLSCKEEKVVLRNKNLRALNVEQIFDTISSKYVKYDNFYSKFSLKTNLLKIDSKGTIKIKRDSIIWVSITPMLGIEAARITVTHDSIKILNRLTKEYICKDFTYISKLTGISVNYSILQSILLNELFTIDSSQSMNNYTLEKLRSTKDFSLIAHTKKILHDDYRSNISYNHTFTIDNRILRPNKIFIEDFKNDQYLSIVYDNYEEVDSFMLPFEIKTITYSNKDSVSLDISYSKSKLNKTLEYSFSVPSNYKTIH